MTVWIATTECQKYTYGVADADPAVAVARLAEAVLALVRDQGSDLASVDEVYEYYGITAYPLVVGGDVVCVDTLTHYNPLVA